MYRYKRQTNSWCSNRCLAKEPPENDHPYMELLSLPNFILTPHTAWASSEAMQILSDQMIDNIENFVEGEPSNVVS